MPVDVSRYGKVPEEGVEPSRPCGHWILNPATISGKAQTYQELRENESGEVPVLVPSLSEANSGPPVPPDLVSVVDAWSGLPDAIKAGILALVRTAMGTGQPSAVQPESTDDSALKMVRNTTTRATRTT